MRREPARSLGLSVFVSGLLVAAGVTGAGEPRDETASKVAELDVWGSVSPSGTKLAFVDWSTGNLALRDLPKGQNYRLTDKGTWMESGEFGMFPIFSPDESRIAYAWFNAEGYWDLRLQSLESADVEVLFADSEHPYVQPHAFSPDGTGVVATVQDGPLTNRLVRFDVGDGSQRTLASLGWRVPSSVCFVAGGEGVVFDRLPDGSTKRMLYHLPSEGDEIPLGAEASDHLLLGCSPDGRQVLFASDRTGDWSLWRLPLSSEAKAGPAERMAAEIESLVRGLGVTRDGTLYYGVQHGRTDLYLGEIDPDSGEPPLRRIAGPVLFNSTAAWSRDGEQLAYVAESGPTRTGLLYSFDLVIRSMESDEETRHPLAMTTFGGHTFDLDWSGDGRFVLAQGRDRSGREGYYRIDVASGAVETAVQTERCPPACLEWPTLAADGTLYFTRWAADGQRVVARDLASGRERELMPVRAPAAAGPLSISPDGEWLAVLWKDMADRTALFKMMAPRQREGRDLARIDPPLWVAAIDWLPESRHLLYVTTDGDGRAELWRLPLDFRPPEKLGSLAEGLRVYALRVHPDGERIAVTAGSPRRSEVWVVEAAAGPPRIAAPKGSAADR